jgi:hypothetical protein
MSLILSAADVAALHDRHEGVRIRYSGRGMYGSECVGVIADDPVLFAFDLAVLTGGTDWADDTTPGDLRDELENLGPPCSDSMGLSTIWYWTRVTVAADVADDEEPEE